MMNNHLRLRQDCPRRRLCASDGVRRRSWRLPLALPLRPRREWHGRRQEEGHQEEVEAGFVVEVQRREV